ncbi:MAG: hypothetical protein IPJ01_12060 [Micavibrio sp.]|nr:hypothetical protein [Micavibrio sp.]
MLINKQTNFDESLRMAVAQTITANINGKDADGADIVLDLENMKGQAVMLNLSSEGNAATTVVDVFVDTSDDNTFAAGVFTDEILNINETAARTVAKAYPVRGFTPKGRYARVRYGFTSGSLGPVTAWASITG